MPDPKPAEKEPEATPKRGERPAVAIHHLDGDPHNNAVENRRVVLPADNRRPKPPV